jgi:endonuclease III
MPSIQKSGSMWHKKKTAHGPDIRRICAALKRCYGTSRLGNPRDPLDDLIYIILSTRTRHLSFDSTYRILKETFSSWDKLRLRLRRRLERILAPGGLGRLKAGQILEILSTLRKTFGRATLAPLSKMSDSEAEMFLTSLPGVGLKVAKCVMMYTLGRRVLPVDIHVHRIAKRIGFQTKKRPDTSQPLIEASVPPHLRYGFHVNAIAHGRAICLSQRPRCELCVISRWCAYYKRRDNRSQ